ncbi:MAG: TRAP transporter substrate-binding protein DctP [Spirochaetota bacterium]|nr:TRAP transporter substrate-binding protein DctP [Spirochaetota bacterium]
MRGKRLFIAVSSVCFIIVILLSLLISSLPAQKSKVYTFTFSELNAYKKINMPQKYRPLWVKILKTRKQGRDAKSLIANNRNNIDNMIKAMKLKSKQKDYLKDLILDKNPVMEIIVKGAGTPPKGTPQYDIAVYKVFPALYKAITRITKKVRMKIIYYPGGIIGDEPDFIRKIKLGELQWAGGQTIMGQMICPELCVFDFPFIYDYEPKLYWEELKFCGIDWIWGKVSPAIHKFLNKRGFELAGLLDGGGWSAISSKDVPVSRAEDLGKLVYPLFPGARIGSEIKNALGFKKVIVSRVWDITTNSATGMINSAMCSWYWHILLQITPYYKYVTDYPLDGYSGAISLFDNSMLYSIIKIFDNIGPLLDISRKDAVKIVRTVLLSLNKETKELMRPSLRKKDAEARRSLLSSGTYKLIPFPTEEIEKVKDKVVPLYNKLADKKDTYPKWFLEDILKYREEYDRLKKAKKLTDKWWKDGIYPDGYDEWGWIRDWGKELL